MLTLIVLLIFPFAIWSARKNINMAKASPTWPSVNGVITSSQRVRRGFWKQARVTYSYSVDNVPYTAKRVSFENPVSKGEIETVLSRYPADKAVTVHYLPGNPVQAVLEPGAGPRVFAQFRSLIIIFVVLILVNILLFYLRAREEDEPSARISGGESSVSLWLASESYRKRDACATLSPRGAAGERT